MLASQSRVVLLDPDHWDAFELFAPAVRRYGLEIVRLMADPHAVPVHARVLDRMMFGKSREALPPGGGNIVDLAPAIERWMCPPTVDVQGPDELMELWRGVGAWPDSAAARRVPDPKRVALLHNKRAMGEFAASLGLVVPRSWTDPPSGILPVIVKATHGSGGLKVRVARDEQELSEAYAEMHQDGLDDVFYQEYESGPIETFGGVAHGGHLLVGGIFRTLTSEGDPLGPAERIQIIESAAISDQVKVLCQALEYTGFFCADFVARPDGSAALIDFNPRVFGSWLAMQEAGVDLLGAYLSIFGLEGPEPTQSGQPVGQIRVVRHIPKQQVSSWREWRGEARTSLGALSGPARVIGRRYLFVAAARSTARLAVSAMRLARSVG